MTSITYSNVKAIAAQQTHAQLLYFSASACKPALKSRKTWVLLLLFFCMLGMSGCSIFKKPSGSKGGGYYQNDGPGDPSQMGTEHFKDAVPRVDPLSSGSNKPYTVLGKRYVPDTREIPFRQRGVASWYGKQFHGRPTSSGEKYDMYAMTAAHTTLPIPCYVRVTNVANGRSIIVRVNDRGPFSDKRIIDLSYGAAYRLDYINKGTAEVIIERIMPADIRAGRVSGNSSEQQSPPPSIPATNASVFSSGFYVQAGAYSSQGNAQKMLDQLSSQNTSLGATLTIIQDGQLYKVFVGPYTTQSQAQSAGDQIQQQTGAGVMVLDRR